MPDTTYAPKVYRTNGGDKEVVASGGVLDIETGGEFRIAGTAVTATAAEINAISGGGLSAAELGVLDGVTPGTSAASKAVVLGADSKISALDITLLKVGGTDKTTAVAAAVATPVAGVAASYKVARGVAAVTGTATVATGLTTVVAVIATAQDDLDGDALAGVSATIGDQAGAPVAGSVVLKTWKVTTGGAAGNPTLIAATAAKNVNWIAIGV